MESIKDSVAGALAVILVAFLVLAGAYGVWKIRSCIYYDQAPVKDTIKETVKPECLLHE